MKMDDVFPSKYLKASDLDSKPRLFVISRVVLEKIGDDSKPVIYFQQCDKGMVCNKTNFSRMAFFLGEESDNWTGKEVVLYPEMVDFQGKPTWSIRVRPPKRPTSGTAPISPAPERVPASAQTPVDLDQEVPF